MSPPRPLRPATPAALAALLFVVAAAVSLAGAASGRFDPAAAPAARLLAGPAPSPDQTAAVGPNAPAVPPPAVTADDAPAADDDGHANPAGAARPRSIAHPPPTGSGRPCRGFAATGRDRVIALRHLTC